MHNCYTTFCALEEANQFLVHCQQFIFHHIIKRIFAANTHAAKIFIQL